MADDTEHFGGAPLGQLWGGPPQGAMDLSAHLILGPGLWGRSAAVAPPGGPSPCWLSTKLAT